MATLPNVPATTLDLLASSGPANGTALESLDAPPASYATLKSAVNAVSAVLQTRGVQRGDRVALVSPNSAAMVTAFLGATAAGTCAPLNPMYGRTELDFFLGDLVPQLLLVDKGLDTPARDAARARGIPVVELGNADGAISGGVTLDGQVPDGVLSPPPWC